MTDFPDRFGRLKEIYLDRKGEWQRFEVEWAQIVSGRPVLKLAGFDDRDEIARLTNAELAITPDQLMELPKGTFYVFDLIGCEVIDEENGERIGELVDVLRYPANDVYSIRTRTGREVLFPAVADFVRKIDIEGRKMTIRKAGLFDETDLETGP